MPDYALAVDMGGTKVAAALVSPDAVIAARAVEPTDQSGPASGIEQVIRLCRRVLPADPDRVVAVGVGIPAVLAPETDHVIWAPNLAGWRDVPLRARLEAALDLPVAVEYDGHTAVLGEWWAGAGQGTTTLVSVIIGTGIGGGIIANGALLRGRDRLAGAAGWFGLTDNVRARDHLAQEIGHWESLAAGPGIVRRARAGLNAAPDSVLHQSPPDDLTSRAIFDAARAGDAFALSVVRETAELIGLGVANIVSLLNPDRVVLGGSVGSQGDLLLPRVREIVLDWAQPASARSVEIVSSTLGNDAGLLGAAYAAFNRLPAREFDGRLRKNATHT